MTSPLLASALRHEPRTTPTSAVLLLHGLGSNADDLFGLAPILAAALPDTVFISPNAPDPCDMAPMGYQWFSLREWSEAAMLQGIRRAATSLEGLINDVASAYHLPPNRIALLGFSQGSMMALHVAPRLASPLAGVVGFSGALVGAGLLTEEIQSRPPVLLVHGEADPVVPFAAMAAAAEVLEALAVPVETLACPFLPHSIDEAGLQRSATFLQKHLSPA